MTPSILRDLRGLCGEDEGMSERIEKINDAIEVTHGCKARHSAAIPITEPFKGEAIVELFNLEGHTRALRCSAWSYQQGAETHYTTVLKFPPVTSAHTAVQGVLVAQARRN